MAVTIAEVAFDTFVFESGKRRSRGIFDITFDAAYPTGGETVDLARWFRSILHAGYPVKDDGNADGYAFGVDRTNFATGSFTIEVFWDDLTLDADAVLTEVALNTNIATLVTRIEVWGFAW